MSDLIYRLNRIPGNPDGVTFTAGASSLNVTNVTNNLTPYSIFTVTVKDDTLRFTFDDINASYDKQAVSYDFLSGFAAIGSPFKAPELPRITFCPGYAVITSTTLTGQEVYLKFEDCLDDDDLGPKISLFAGASGVTPNTVTITDLVTGVTIDVEDLLATSITLKDNGRKSNNATTTIPIVEYYPEVPSQVLVGTNATYIGFGGSTGGSVDDEHWIRDFVFTSPLETVEFSELTANSTFLGTATLEDIGVRLTPTGTYNSGNVFYNTPVFVRDKADRVLDWSVHFTFSCGGGYGGDGFSFILQSNDTTVTGLNGGGLGYAGIPFSIAVSYDSYNNGLPFGDSAYNQIELNVNGDVNSIRKVTVPNFRGTTGTDSLRYTWIDYVDQTINIYYSLIPTKPEFPSLAYDINILDYITT